MEQPTTIQTMPVSTAATPAATARGFASGRFYTCVAILLLSSVAMQSVAAALGGYFRKHPLPLKQPLYLLDRNKLLPNYDLSPIQPPPLTDEVVENLGTTEYLDWHVLDTTRGRDDPLHKARLFITYYTGQPDLVPHNPKECLAAGGFSLARETLVHVDTPHPDGSVARIPVSILEFEPPRRGPFVAGDGTGDAPRLTVAYFFYANGAYVTTRNQVRVQVSSLTDRYAYYSKVEIVFTSSNGMRLATREQTIEAVQPLLRTLMPILWTDHYQDWSAIEDGQPPAIAGS